MVTDEKRNFFNDEYSRIAYGVHTGYPCCTTNMHQGWPKFIQNLWYATADNGIAALVYGPSEVTATVAGGTTVRFAQHTDYPFRDQVILKYLEGDDVTFPLHARIPGWCDTPVITLNGETVLPAVENGIAIIEREWKEGDEVTLRFPMEIRVSEWAQNSRGVERGPLVYALKVGEEWSEVTTDEWPNSFYEVKPLTPWNYALLEKRGDLAAFEVEESSEVTDMPWNIENAPVSLKTRGVRLPYWQLYNGSAGPVPVRNLSQELGDIAEEGITLLPYGCTTLRISQFPVISVREF